MTPFMALFERRVRGVRLIEVVTGALCILLVLWVYLAKADASAERNQIATLEREIREEQKAVRLLRAEAAHLEQPDRIEALARNFLAMEPTSARDEVRPEALIEVARLGAPARPAPVDPATKVPMAETVTAPGGAGAPEGVGQ
ncbi:MAG: hypothetical protein ACK41P_07395 [Asticcacaulis sp.]